MSNKTVKLLMLVVLIFSSFLGLYHTFISKKPISKEPAVDESPYVIRFLVNDMCETKLLDEFQKKYASDIDVNTHSIELRGFKDLEDAELTLNKISNDFPCFKFNMLILLNTVLLDNDDLILVDHTHNSDLFRYVNKNNETILSSYLQIEGFNEGFTLLSSPLGYVFLNENGHSPFGDVFENAQLFYENSAAVMKNGKWFYINKTGGTIINELYLSAGIFSEGLACVSMDGRGFGYINTQGVFSIEPRYAGGEPFKGGIAETYGLSQTYQIDVKGQIIRSQNDTYKRSKLRPQGHTPDTIQLFIDELLSKIKNKDIQYLKQLISQDTKFDSENRLSPAEFYEKWGLNDSFQNSPLWDDLLVTLSLGIDVHNEHSFEAPSLHERLPEEFDALTFGCIFKNEANIYDSPKLDASILDHYGNEVIALMHYGLYTDALNDKWLTVVLCDGRIGYIQKSNVCINTDLTVHFINSNKQWQIVFIGSQD